MRTITLNAVLIFGLQAIVISVASAMSLELNSVKLIEQNDSRLVATSNYNYAITSPKLLTKNWKTVSVNGEKVVIITTTGEVISKTQAELNEEDRVFIKNLRDEISNGGSSGFSYLTSMAGGESSPVGNIMMASNVGGAGSGSSTSTSFSSSTSGFPGSVRSPQVSGMSVNMRDENNFSVSKSDLPFNWFKVFMNGDLVTMVTREAEVEMRPLASLDPARLAAIEKLKRELKEMQSTQAQQLSSTMQNSMDMVSNVFSNIMGQFPKPPSYKSAVGDMFGDNFPFGPNNSPFSAASGWPFGGGGGGAGAFAFASRR